MVISMFLVMVHHKHTPTELRPWFILATLEALVEGVIFSLTL